MEMKSCLCQGTDVGPKTCKDVKLERPPCRLLRVFETHAATGHSVFPGITLTYDDVRESHCPTAGSSSETVLEIHHCKEGRMERAFEDGFFYLSPGDLALNRGGRAGADVHYPLGRYQGITIEIDLNRTPDCLACFLEDVNVRPHALFEKFCGEKSVFVMRAKPSLEHIFSELYHVPPTVRQGYFKVKILELMLFLSGLDEREGALSNHSCTKSQVALAKEVCCHLTEHMDKKITIETLAKRFHASPTMIKNSFKGVYGVSVYAYIRAQKMQAAAFALRQTDTPVLEIAGQYGYDNGSKFAKAFKETMGMSPREYRAFAEV